MYSWTSPSTYLVCTVRPRKAHTSYVRLDLAEKPISCTYPVRNGPIGRFSEGMYMDTATECDFAAQTRYVQRAHCRENPQFWMNPGPHSDEESPAPGTGLLLRGPGSWLRSVFLCRSCAANRPSALSSGAGKRQKNRPDANLPADLQRICSTVLRKCTYGTFSNLCLRICKTTGPQGPQRSQQNNPASLRGCFG